MCSHTNPPDSAVSFASGGIDENHEQAILIEERLTEPKLNCVWFQALCFCDNDVVEIAKTIEHSAHGEWCKITAVNQAHSTSSVPRSLLS